MWSDLLSEVFDNPTSALIGIPMGKHFMPPSGSFTQDFISGKGYDPHNSHLAILYRMGLLGFTFYGLLILLTIYRSLKIIRLRFLNPELRLYLLGFVGAFIVIIGNGFFSVILESPHQAIFFWIILGAIFTIQNIAFKELSLKNYKVVK